MIKQNVYLLAIAAVLLKALWLFFNDNNTSGWLMLCVALFLFLPYELSQIRPTTNVTVNNYSEKAKIEADLNGNVIGNIHENK